MKLIVGLGNPGIAYQFTPHNLGFLAIDRMANERGVEVRNRQCHALTAGTTIGAEPVLLAKPETFMNLSGMAVRELAARHEIRPESDLIVIYDELDLPLGTQEFLRIRLGIAPERKITDEVKFVLTPFRKSQLSKVDEVLDNAAEAVSVILQEGPAAAMNRFNRKTQPED